MILEEDDRRFHRKQRIDSVEEMTGRNRKKQKVKAKLLKHGSKGT